jgi:hypothetical protein
VKSGEEVSRITSEEFKHEFLPPDEEGGEGEGLLRWAHRLGG